MGDKEKSIAVMQPYFIPYIGYFQLMNKVDEFVIYDNIQFSKSGWIHRNRILENGKDVYISLPIKKDSDFLDVRERFLADNYEKLKIKFLSKFKNNYQKAPYFKETMPLVEELLNDEERNLFTFIYNTLIRIRKHLKIKTQITISSEIDIDHSLTSSDKIKAIVKKRNASSYINPIGGIELYKKDDFKKDDIDLKFIKTNDFIYSQFDNEFNPFLSIVDILMFNGKEESMNLLENYELE
mgnify:CR=1 FL=1